MKHNTGQTITDLLKERNMTQADLAKAAGVSQQAVQQWCSGYTAPRGKNLLAVCDVLKTSPSFILFGLDSSANAKIPGAEFDDKFVRISHISISGSFKDDLPPIHSIKATDSWILAKCPSCDPKKLGLLTAQGNSMMPTIAHLDLVIVDTSAKTIKSDGVYVVSFAGETYIRRIQKQIDGGVLIITDNQQFPPIRLSKDELGEITIKGRCILTLPAVTI